MEEFSERNSGTFLNLQGAYETSLQASKNHLFKPFNGLNEQQTRLPVLGTRNSVHKDASGICCIIPESPLQTEMFSSESFATEDKLPLNQNSNPYPFSRGLRLQMSKKPNLQFQNRGCS